MTAEQAPELVELLEAASAFRECDADARERLDAYLEEQARDYVRPKKVTQVLAAARRLLAAAGALAFVLAAQGCARVHEPDASHAFTEDLVCVEAGPMAAHLLEQPEAGPCPRIATYPRAAVCYPRQGLAVYVYGRHEVERLAGFCGPRPFELLDRGGA